MICFESFQNVLSLSILHKNQITCDLVSPVAFYCKFYFSQCIYSMSEVDEKEDSLKKLIEALPPVKIHSCDLSAELFLKMHISE